MNKEKECTDCTECQSAGWCSCVIITILLIIAIAVGASSVYRVDPWTMSLTKDSLTNTVNRNETLINGYYLKNPSNRLLDFPASIQNREFKSLSIWSKASNEDAGIFLNIDVVLQYTIIPEELGLLYAKVGPNYDSLISSTTTSALKNEAVKWSADDYLMNRKLVERSMFWTIKDAMLQINLNVTSLQILDIVFPDVYYERKLDSSVQRQNNVATLYQSNANIIRGETSQIVQYINNRGTQVNKTALFQAENIKELAETEASRIIQDARVNGLSLIKQELGITSSSEFLSLDYLLQLELSKMDYYVGFKQVVSTMGV